MLRLSHVPFKGVLVSVGGQFESVYKRSGLVFRLNNL